MRVVVDTNILVSFAIRPNTNFEKIFVHIAAQGVTLVSEDTLAELVDVLNREKFRRYIPSSRVIDYVEWYIAISEIAVVTEPVVACRDPKDDKFLALALARQGRLHYRRRQPSSRNGLVQRRCHPQPRGFPTVVHSIVANT